jgi:precorrin-6A/cobalt-precorrin-6A reductase
MIHLLILGGTQEASALAKVVADANLRAVLSYAGRVARPARQPIPCRIGGFGGVQGLASYIQTNDITHVVDATHPFAAQMSRNAVSACAQTKTPLIALTRPQWKATKADRWRHVPDLEAAAKALQGPAQNVFLAVGRMHLDCFATQPQHRYLLRLVDAPHTPLPLPNATPVIARGPFDRAADRALLQKHAIEIVVAKNAGGDGARAKIDAARDLGLPVLMIDRPDLPQRHQANIPQQVLDWLAHCGTDRGV